jgi:type I restriction enzyme M protein
MSVHDNALGEAIRRARTREGLTQAELAREVGVSQGQISAWETGRTSPPDEHQHALKRVLGRIVVRQHDSAGANPPRPDRPPAAGSRRRGPPRPAHSGAAGSPSLPNASAVAGNGQGGPPVRAKALTQQELEARLWTAADSLRGPVDPADFKAFIFPLLFFKWISDTWDMEHQEAVDVYGPEVGEEEEADFHRFVVPAECHWDDLRRTSANVGVKLGLILDRLQSANPGKLASIFGDVAWGNKERLPEASLLNLINAFNSLQLNPKVVPHDVLGAAYEYLLKQFADASGKKAGEFFTPRAVVRLLVSILDPQPGETIYDPACGSGGMLVEAIGEVREKGGDPRTLRLYGQEVNLTTAAIARMNLFLHEIEDFSILRGDTLRDPRFRTETGDLQRFDVVIANPPFSLANWGADVWVSDVRAFAGVPPASTGDFAWVQHMVYSMTRKAGRVGVVMPHGVLFRGNVEKQIRQKLVESDLLEAVIGLPPNLFYSTTIPACLLLFRAAKVPKRKGRVLFVDGAKCFSKGRNQNTMSDVDVTAILDAYRTATDNDGGDAGVRLVEVEDIASNEWDLNITRYIKGAAAEVLDVPTALAQLREAQTSLRAAEDALAERLKAAGYA